MPNILGDMYESLKPNTDWSELEDRASDDLSVDLETVLRDVRQAGVNQVFRVDMTRPEFEIPVVRILVPGTSLPSQMVHLRPKETP